MDYILITPARNEIELLPIASEALINQTLLPKLWLILDDNSTDGTSEYIHRLESVYPWIISTRMPPSPGGLGKHFAEVVSCGFDRLIMESQKRAINYELIGKIDADVDFGPTCFFDLIQEFAADPRLGIASPMLAVYQERKKDIDSAAEPDRALLDHPTDAIRLYNRQCFEEIGRISTVRAPETVAEVKAILRGWKTRRIENITCKHLRKVHASNSLWSRMTMTGSEAYYLGYHPLLAFGRMIYDLIWGKPKHRFLAYAWGFVRGYMFRESRINDAEVLEYFGSQRLHEVMIQLYPRYFKRRHETL